MPTLTRKITLLPVGDRDEVNRVYQFIKDGCYNQNKAYNILYSRIFSAYIGKESTEKIKDIWKRGERCPKKDDPDYSLYDYSEIKFVRGIPQASALGQQAKSAFAKQIRDGLLKGRVALATRKLDAPMWIKTNFSFYHNYKDHNDFLDHLEKDDLEIFMKFVNGISFKVVFGNVHKSATIRKEFKCIIENFYKLQGSTIQIKDKKIILNLSMQVPQKKVELDERTVGVDLGMAIPAMCALSDSLYIRKGIGNAQDFLRVRLRMQAERKQLQRNLVATSGGHGRKKKLTKLEVLEEREKNFAKTYNHMVSKKVVDFAIENKAKYINLEDLSGYDANEVILRNWSYYQLQTDIKYKAELNGIEVRFINPYHTSQICSYCGHWEEGQRKTQKDFICKNPECKNFGISVNADFNAARNIAMSKDFIK